VVAVTTSPLADGPTLRHPRPAPLSGRPWGWLSGWLSGWACVAQLVLDLALAVPLVVFLTLFVVTVVLVPVLGIGIPGVLLGLLLARGAGPVERARLRAFTGAVVHPPPGPPPGASFWRRFVADPRAWKGLAYMSLLMLWGFTVGTAVLATLSLAVALAALPLYRGAVADNSLELFGLWTVPASSWWALIGVLALALLPLAAWGLARVDVALAGLLLGGGRTEQVRALSQRVETLTQTRVGTVDSVEAERRRIERDLHDGPQQRLVAIAMDLGMARERLGQDPEAARQLVDHAHSAAKDAITEMRQVARGIHPPVLTDRGLDAALSALAAASPVPVHVAVELDHRPGPTLEAIAYFCVSEALTNVAKHAQARQAWVDVRQRDGLLVAEVRDDGVGGADLTGGTGLVGLRQRAAAVDGTVAVTSPPGGPTVVTISLPDLPAPPAPDVRSEGTRP
jgi:signal transduction histidine kinase